ncbi:reverse transcriptase domain-containing protein [Tanacetum coccineum]
MVIKALTFNLDQTSRYSSNYDDISVNRIDVIDVACEEYSQEVLGLSVKGDILLLEEFLNDDPSSLPLPPQELLKLNFQERIEVDTLKFDVIAKLPHPTTVKGIRSFLGHAGFYHRFIQDFSKIARPMTRLLEKDTPFFFSKECIEAFQTLKKKLTEAPILVAPDWDLPFELMCDASDFAIGAVLGQRKTKHFQPIHYASKTMTDAQAHYTTTEKELLVVVYAFEKFRPYLVLSKSIVYTDHSALKYLFNKQDAKPRLLRTPWFADFANYYAGNFVVKEEEGKRGGGKKKKGKGGKGGRGGEKSREREKKKERKRQKEGKKGGGKEEKGGRGREEREKGKIGGKREGKEVRGGGGRVEKEEGEEWERGRGEEVEGKKMKGLEGKGEKSKGGKEGGGGGKEREEKGGKGEEEKGGQEEKRIWDRRKGNEEGGRSGVGGTRSPFVVPFRGWQA